MAKPRAENRAGGRRAFPNTPHAPRMRPVYSVASGDGTNSRTEDSRRARLRADPFGVSSRTRLRCLPCQCVLPESRRTLTVTLRSLWNLLNLRVRFLTILCLTRGVTC